MLVCTSGLPLSSFFVNDTATTEIYTLSLHDALPIFDRSLAVDGGLGIGHASDRREPSGNSGRRTGGDCFVFFPDRKSTRLNSSHANISYAVFCLKKKTTTPLLISRPRICMKSSNASP